MAKKQKKTSSAANPKQEITLTNNPELQKQLDERQSAAVNLDDLTPEQLTQIQLEQAIKEANNPESRLKKVHSPINLRSFLVSLLIFFVGVVVILYIGAAIAVDKFDFRVITIDMLDKFGISGAWESIKNWFIGLFGGESTPPPAQESIKWLLRK